MVSERAWTLLGTPTGAKAAAMSAQSQLWHGKDPEQVKESLKAYHNTLDEDEISEIVEAENLKCKESKSRFSPPPKGGEEEEKLFKTVSVGQVIESAPTVEFLIDRLVPRQGVLLATGPGGDGKSFFATEMALCVDQGIPFLGFECHRGKVLFVDEEEGEKTLGPRLRRLLQGKQQDSSDIAVEMLIQKGVNLSHGKTVRAFERLLSEHEPDLVILDSLIRLHSAQESSADEMRGIMGTLLRLAHDHGCAICVIHHDRKPGHGGHDPKFSFRGSTDIQNAVDFHIDFHRVQRDRDLFEVSFGKRRNLPTGHDSFYFEIADGEDDSITVSRSEGPEPSPGRTEQTVAFLRSALADGGPRLLKDIHSLARSEGYAKNTVDDARNVLRATGEITETVGPGRGSPVHIRFFSSTPPPIGAKESEDLDEIRI